ncbi:hypothetical protein, partial [Bacillus paralicheniformis]
TKDYEYRASRVVQETYPGDPYSEAAAEVIPTYFAYSASGSVAAEVVYANYGNTKDYEYLASRVVQETYPGAPYSEREAAVNPT